MGAIIKADNLIKKYSIGRKEIYALNKVTAETQKSMLTIFRGRSGSGKTTLLNQLCLLDRPDSGEIIFNDVDALCAGDSWRDTCRRKSIGIIFQSVALMPHMTALENVDFGLRIAGFGTSGRRERALDSLAMVNMSNRAAHLPAELSGGEQQRVAIARAIAHKPLVLFADEPTAELDTQTGFQVIRVFLDLIEKEGVTVIMTTHDPAFMEMGSKVYTLEDGEIVDEQ